MSFVVIFLDFAPRQHNQLYNPKWMLPHITHATTIKTSEPDPLPSFKLLNVYTFFSSIPFEVLYFLLSIYIRYTLQV